MERCLSRLRSLLVLGCTQPLFSTFRSEYVIEKRYCGTERHRVLDLLNVPGRPIRLSVSDQPTLLEAIQYGVNRILVDTSCLGDLDGLVRLVPVLSEEANNPLRVGLTLLRVV